MVVAGDAACIGHLFHGDQCHRLGIDMSCVSLYMIVGVAVESVAMQCRLRCCSESWTASHQVKSSSQCYVKM